MDNNGIKDRTEGTMKETGGHIQRETGRVLNDEEMREEGAENESEGKLQKAWGDVKDAASDLVD